MTQPNIAMVNPSSGIEPADVVARADAEGLVGHVVFATSGSQGAPKWVALSNEALELSAKAVNRVLEARPDDVWLRALPEFHVGGYAIGIRARVSGAEVRVLEGKWDTGRFVDAVDGASLCSLVPTQVHDIVSSGVRAPASVRVVLVGGAAFSGQLRRGALDLGWPVRATYGLTEAGSSVAIDDGSGSLRLLDIWRARVVGAGSLEIAGDALFTQYLGGSGPGDWFATGDLAQLDGDRLCLEGRSDAVVKVLGEQVDLDSLQSRLPGGFAVVALPDERSGHQLLLVAEQDPGDQLDRFNQDAAGFERLKRVVRVDAIPRSPLGKIRRQALTDQVCEKMSEA